LLERGEKRDTMMMMKQVKEERKEQVPRDGVLIDTGTGSN
jgi:hypothetical protein